MHAPASKPRLAAMALIVVVCVHLSALWITKSQILAGRPDFSSFYAAGKLLITGNGHSLYNLEAQSRAQQQFQHRDRDRAGTLPFGHPPFELILFAPLAALPYSTAFGLWYLANLGLLLGSIFVLRNHVPIIRDRLAVVLVLVGCFYPVIVTIVQGQDSIVLLFLFCLLFARLESGREPAAGLLLSLCTFKFQLVLPTLIALLVTRRWKAISGFALGCVALILASAALLGPASLIQYPRFLDQYARLPAEIAAIYPEQMPSLRGLLVFLPKEIPAPLLFAAISLCLFAALAYTCMRAQRRAPASRRLAFAACLSVTVFTAYHLNMHDVALLALPLILAADHVRSKKLGITRRATLAAAAFAVYLAPALSHGVLITAVSTLVLGLLLMNESLGGEFDEPAPSDTRERISVVAG